MAPIDFGTVMLCIQKVGHTHVLSLPRSLVKAKSPTAQKSFMQANSAWDMKLHYGLSFKDNDLCKPPLDMEIPLKITFKEQNTK